MNPRKMVVAGAIVATGWCAAPQAQTVAYGLGGATSTSTGTSPELSNTSPYPKHPGNAGFAVSGYWDNGVWWERRDPIVVDSGGTIRYVHPETARMAVPPHTVYLRQDRSQRASLPQPLR